MTSTAFRRRPRWHPPSGDDEAAAAPVAALSTLTDDDLYWFNEGTHRSLAGRLGAHPRPGGGAPSPSGRRTPTGVAVIGDFNGWDPRQPALAPR